MKCRIRQETSDALKAATLAGDIDSFGFQYVHKGVEFSMESKTGNLDNDEWEDMLHEIYFDNDLPESSGFYPKIFDDELVLNFSCSVHLNYEGESRSFWDNGELLILIRNELAAIVNAEVSEDDVILQLSMSADENGNGTVESYGFNCFHPETGEEFDLTEDQSLKAIVKAYVYNWANDKCYMGDGGHKSFFIDISESSVGTFYENFSGRVELVIV